MVLARIAPATAERVALGLFSRPRRRRQARDPGAPGDAGHRFTIRTRQGAIAAWDWGQGPTVVLVHGWNGQAAQMSGFVAPLVRAGFHVLAFDQPAHGQSDGRRATVLDFERAVSAVSARVAPVHGIIAHSLGATATAMAVRRGLGARVGVERVVLLAPPADPAPFARAFARAAGLPAARAEGVVARVSRLVGEAPPPAPTDARLLILHDPGDPEVPFAHGQAIAATWPGSRLRPAPGLGHHPLLRDPAAIEWAVSFVTGRNAGRPAPLALRFTNQM
jgi:pimeloyl-ACP methyl ester carboxylesterase